MLFKVASIHIQFTNAARKFVYGAIPFTSVKIFHVVMCALTVFTVAERIMFVFGHVCGEKIYVIETLVADFTDVVDVTIFIMHGSLMRFHISIFAKDLKA